MSALIQTHDLQRSFKVRAGLFKPSQTLHAVNGINLSVNRGDVLGLWQINARPYAVGVDAPYPR